MTGRRIVFLDIDGTILDHGKTVADSTVRAVEGARAAGHLVFLCTGRASGQIPDAVSAIGFDGAVTNGGAYARVGQDVIVAEPMPREAAEQLVGYFEEQRILFFVQTDAAVHAPARVREEFPRIMRRWQPDDPSDRPQTAPQQPTGVRDLADADFDAVAKAVFIGEETDTVARIQADLAERFHVVPGSMPLPGGSNGEVGLRGTSKGSAIQAVLDHLGLDRSQAIGVGDSWNDVEMFEVCGVGIAMGNAADELKQLADETTTGVADDGVWNAFVRHELVSA